MSDDITKSDDSSTRLSPKRDLVDYREVQFISFDTFLNFRKAMETWPETPGLAGTPYLPVETNTLLVPTEAIGLLRDALSPSSISFTEGETVERTNASPTRLVVKRKTLNGPFRYTFE